MRAVGPGAANANFAFDVTVKGVCNVITWSQARAAKATDMQIIRQLKLHACCWAAKPRPGEIGDAVGVLDLLWLLLTTVQATLRPRQDLILENLLLRHQLAALTRPTRTRPPPRLRLWDKLLWVLARRFCRGWREHLTIVTPDTVVRWHRQGWRLFWRWKSRSRD